MHRKHLVLPVAAALALSLSACGEHPDKTTNGPAPGRTAQGPVTSAPVPGERPGAPGNPRGLRDTSPSIPGSGENRPAKKEEPFGQGSPQTSMKGAEIPSVAGASNENKVEGRRYDSGR